MSDDIERSVASAGSHGVAAAWAAFADDTGDTGVTSLNRASVEEVANRMGWSVVPLYRSPTLTDAEREALRKVLRRVREDYFAGRFADSVEVAAVIDGLLERTE